MSQPQAKPMHRDLVEQYEKGQQKLSLAIRGLTAEDLRTRPGSDAPADAGKWSAQEVAVHLADAEVAFADRIKRIVAMDEPVLQAWDENRFTERLMYDEQSAEDAAALVEVTRRQLSKLLKKLPDAAFARTGRHTERGRQTLTDVLKYAVEHLDHHVRFIHRKREVMGKEMW
jgi:uncharacterized damage-inducible protein DinB